MTVTQAERRRAQKGLADAATGAEEGVEEGQKEAEE